MGFPAIRAAALAAVSLFAFSFSGQATQEEVSPLPAAPVPGKALVKDGTGVFYGGSDRWRAQIAGGDMRMTIPCPTGGMEPYLSYRLSSVGSPGDTIYQDDGSPVDASASGEDCISLGHAWVEEIYESRAAGLEQSFRITRAPADGGPVSVRGRFTTNLHAPPSGSCETAVFTIDGAPGISVGECLVIDADGATHPVGLAIDGSDIVLSVPAGLSYPVLVDPLFGALFVHVPPSLGNASPHGYVPTDIAYNPTADEYFIVWNQWFSAGADGTTGGSANSRDDVYHVFGVRLHANGGQPLPADQVAISIEPVQAAQVAVDWNPTLQKYLVVYRRYPLVVMTPAQDQIAGATITGAGVVDSMFVVNGDQSTESGTIVIDAEPNVAAMGAAWRVIWQKVDGFPGALAPLTLNNGGLWGRDVTGPGTFACPSFPIVDTSVPETGATIAYSAASNACLVGWDNGLTSGCEVRVATLSTASPPQVGSPTIISPVDSFQSRYVRIAANPVTGSFYCVWYDSTSQSPPDADVRGTIVSSAGVPSGPQFVITSTSNSDGKPDVCFNPARNQVLVVWHRLTYAGNSAVDGDVMLAAFDGSTLQIVEAPVAATATADLERFPACASQTSGTGGCVSWIHDVFNPASTNIEAKRYAFPGPASAPGTLMQAISPTAAPAPAGLITSVETMSFLANLSDADAGSLLQLEAEVKPVGMPFDGNGLVTGPPVTNPAQAYATTGELANGSYHWRARTRKGGFVSGWSAFDSGPTPDFTIDRGLDDGNPSERGGGVGGCHSRAASNPLSAMALIPLLLAGLAARLTMSR